MKGEKMESQEILFKKELFEKPTKFIRVIFEDPFTEEERIVEIPMDEFNPLKDHKKAINKAILKSGMKGFNVLKVEEFDHLKR